MGFAVSGRLKAAKLHPNYGRPVAHLLLTRPGPDATPPATLPAAALSTAASAGMLCVLCKDLLYDAVALHNETDKVFFVGLFVCLFKLLASAVTFAFTCRLPLSALTII